MSKGTARKAKGRNRTASRRAQVASLYLQGLRQIDIAERLNVTQGTVSNDLKAVQKEWLESTIRDFDEHRAQELAKIDEVERNAWEGWWRSVGKVKTKKKVDSPKGTTYEQLIKDQAGDSQFLNIALRCVEKRCQLLGLDAPQKFQVEHTFEDEDALKQEEKRLGLTPMRWNLPTASDN